MRLSIVSYASLMDGMGIFLQWTLMAALIAPISSLFGSAYLMRGSFPMEYSFAGMMIVLVLSLFL